MKVAILISDYNHIKKYYAKIDTNNRIRKNILVGNFRQLRKKLSQKSSNERPFIYEFMIQFLVKKRTLKRKV